MRAIFCGLYLLLVAVVLGGAGYAWSLRCEGFGCTGVGIVWGAWAGLWGLTAILGPVLRGFLTPKTTPHRAVGWAWGLQSVLGLVLLVYWLLNFVVRAG